MDFKKLVDSYKDDIIRTTQELVKIKSVQEEGKKGKPFGEGVNDSLEYALNLSKKMGFSVENFDGYAGHAELGEGEETVGILVHLDVVPEGEGWSYPPYAAEIHNDRIYGRGTIDDKGPAIAALYAMKAIKESGVPFNRKIKIIFGTNEESGWGGINYYLKKNKAPDMAFTPDAEFPVIHGEMGILIFSLNKKFEDTCQGNIIVKSIKGGNRPNMVPDSAEAVIEVKNNNNENIMEKLQDFVKRTGYKLTIEDNNNKMIIKSRGVSAHGSLPESGKNAISQLMLFLEEIIGCNCERSDFIKFYNKKIGMEYNGQSIGCGFEDDVSGKLIFNVGVINFDENEAKVTVNIRYPIKYDSDSIYGALRKELGDTGIEVEEGQSMSPLYVPMEHVLVEKLMDVYREETGDENSKPITIGGGTYARSMGNAVAFGPLFPGKKELAHQKDEYISVEDLMKLTYIYVKALYELAKK